MIEAMQDPRMKYVPLLEEERFQSMAAVPILSRAGETIGVIVLHTRAPHEFGEDTLKLLVHIASLVSGAIENAQLYDRERRRVDALTGLSELAQQVAAAAGDGELGAVLVAGGARALLGAEACQLLRSSPTARPSRCWRRCRRRCPPRRSRSTAEVMVAAARGAAARRSPAQALWPLEGRRDLLVTPLSAGDERVGVLCVGSGPGVRSATRTPRWPVRSPTWPRWRSSGPS